VGQFAIHLGLGLQPDNGGLVGEVQEHNLLLPHVLNDHNFALLEVEFGEVLELVGPEADLDGFELVADDHPDDLLGLLVLPHLLQPVHRLLLDVFNEANHVHVFALDIVVLVFPVVVLIREFAGD